MVLMSEMTDLVYLKDDENTGFLKVFFAIIFVQVLIVNAAIIPLGLFKLIGNMFSCVPFGIKGWIVVLLLSATMIPVDMIRKIIVNKVIAQDKGDSTSYSTVEG